MMGGGCPVDCRRECFRRTAIDFNGSTKRKRLQWLFEDQTCARRHQEAPALQHRHRGFAFSPRDGRFIEKIGFYNPLLPRIMPTA